MIRAVSRGLVCAVITLTAVRAASAQALWGDLRLPGTVDGARRAVAVTMSIGHDDAAWMSDLIRRTYSQANPNSILETTSDYLQYLDAVAAESRRWPKGLTLDAGTERDAARRFAALLGLQVAHEQNRDVVRLSDDEDTKRHVAWLHANGIDVAPIATQLNSGQPALITVPESSLPLPLPSYWAARLHDAPLPLLAIISDRANALMYYGLLSLDDETMQFVGARPQLLDTIHDQAATFSQFGRSLHVRNGVLQIPGGDAAAVGWRRLTGEMPPQAEEFIRSLLPRGDGRMALFYDLLVHFDPAHLHFALGSSIEEQYAWFRSQDPTWSVTARPFHRARLDPSAVLTLTDVSPAGTALAPWWPEVLTRVTASHDWPARPERPQDFRDRPADAAWLLSWIFSSRTETESRWQLVRFLQRVFPAAGKDAIPDVANALRTVRDMPALAFSLERMGVRDPVLFGAVGRTAHELTTSGGQREAAPVVARFQAALALVEQIQRHRRLPVQTLAGLLASLDQMSPNLPGDHQGFVAAWIGQKLLPAIGVTDLGSGRVDHDALVAFSSREDGPPVHITWEGLEYVLDAGPAVAKSVLAIRAVDRLPRLDDVLALSRVQDRLRTPLASLADLAAITTEMTRIESAIAALPPVDGQPPDIVKDFHESVLKLTRINKAENLRQVQSQAAIVDRAVDALTDAVVPPLVYALAVSPSEQPASIFAGAWQSHSVVPLPLNDLRPWERVIWQMPAFEDRAGGGHTLRGAYLGVDLAMANALLRHASAPDMALSPNLDDNDHSAIVTALALRPTAQFDDGPATASIGNALRAGRARLMTWSSASSARVDRAAVRDALAETSIDERRLNVILWTFERTPAKAFEWLRELEIYELGAKAPLPSAWGGLGAPSDGCWCLVTTADRGQIVRSFGFGLAPIALPDLPLSLAEHLTSLGLPLSLVPYLLPAATEDWIDRVLQDGPDDWQALTAWPTRLTKSKVDEYLLQLVSIGVMAPPRQPAPRPDDDRRSQ